MRVYVAAAMTSSERNHEVAAQLVAALEAAGHDVPSRHVGLADSPAVDAAIRPAELARRDLAWVASSDALIAEVSVPSHGVAIEVMTALGAGTPVLLLHAHAARVSRLLLGLEGVRSFAYRSIDEACAEVLRFLAAAR